MSEERKTRRLFHPIKNGQISGGKTSAGARLEANEREAKMGAMIEFSRPDGGKSKGYLASAGNGRPGIVVIQEWWGLNDQICGIADRFARTGYNALAPDLYKGRLTTVADEANHLMTNLNFPDATHQDLRGAVKYLQGGGGPSGAKVGVMGF